ncbi:hypothetical protein ACFQV2_21675 [Actinokineospora soli]|uniref:DUF998 domain-containing protein n=1 Tax=Actinokineospora soli TaxID=1048753 RepID=A0ABW2TRU7_9PSEU
MLALAAYPSPAEGQLVVASAAGALKFLGIVLSALLVLVGLLIKASGTNGRRDKNIEQTYFALRLGAALFLVLLIVGVAHQVIVTPGQSFLGSVSAYYYTPAQAVFVAGLCAVGACLVIYRGNNDTENVVLDFTGFMAFVVAFVPTPAQGGCLDANVVTQEPVAALIRNSITALFIVCGVAVVVAAFSKQVRAGAPLTKFAKRAIGVSAAALLVGLGWFAGARPSFEGCGHAVAAATLFVGIVAVVVLNAAGYARMDRADSRMKHNWYLGVALVMVASLITLVAASQFGYQHWFFTLEAALILEFAVFWLLQSYELRGDVRRPPPQPTTAGDDASADTSDGEPEPSAGTFQTAEPGRA